MKTTNGQRQKRKEITMNNTMRTLLLCGFSAALLSACTTTQTLDLPADRQSNMQQDIELWKNSQRAVPEEGLTLQAAIDMGMENNLAMRAAQFERAMLDDSTRAAKLEMLPDLTASSQRFRRSNQPRQDFLRDSDGQITQSNVRSSFRTGTQSQLEITWSVLDFGLSYVRSRQAGYESLAQQTRTARQAQLLALDITDAFWRSALAEDALDYLRSAEAELQGRKADMKSASEAGLANPLDVALASSRLVDVEIAIRDLQAAVSSARVDLARLLGVPMQQQFRLIREPIRPILSHLPRLPQLNSEAMLRYALLNRPELYESDLNERIREDDVSAAVLSMFPDLTFGLGQYYDNNRLLRNNDWNQASAAVSWNLLNIPAGLAARSSRKNAVEMARFQRLQTTAGVIAQVHLALLDYAAKTDRFLLRDEAAKLTEDVLELRKANYAAGENTVMQVSESQLTAVNAKMQRDRAVVDVLVAYSRLQSSLGVPTKLWPYEMTALCLPQSQLSGTCLAKQGAYTPIVQIDGYNGSGIDDLSVVKIETISHVAENFTGNTAVIPAYNPTSVAPLTYRGEIVEQSVPQNDWVVFVGTFRDPASTLLSVKRATLVDASTFGTYNPISQQLDNGSFRVGFQLPDQKSARSACDLLKSRSQDCWVSPQPRDTFPIPSSTQSL